MRIGYRDESFTTVGWPFSKLEVGPVDALLIGRGGARQIAVSEVAAVIRCGWFVQWGIRVVPHDGERIVLWAPRLPNRLSSMLAVPVERERRRSLVLWQRRVVDDRTKPGSE